MMKKKIYSSYFKIKKMQIKNKHCFLKTNLYNYHKIKN